MMAKQMHNMAIVRSMSTREADHNRGRYYMHTGYVPNPNIEYPSYGSVIAHELVHQRPELEIPPFISVGGASEGPGFLGMAWSPFTVSSNGRIRNLEMQLDEKRLIQRMAALDLIETGFISQQRGGSSEDHRKILKKTLDLMTSAQMDAFRVEKEPEAVQERYGKNNFGQGCLMARRLVEAGVPFIEVDLGGWDNHADIHNILWMGEFGRTPNINGDAGRDHWARSWSVVVGGGGIKGGQAIGATSEDGTSVITEPYSSEDLMASVCKALGISLETTYTSKSGRPMKIANSGKIIDGLVA
jgi:hypothetical protein